MSKRDHDFTCYTCKRQKRSLTSASRFSTEWKYDVFLSFRGEDVRNNFADHLFVALDNERIYTFKDDQTFERGKHLSSIFEAIESSRFSIIIFSKKYADSSWCLDETVKIVTCMALKKHIAFPVFYSVKASEVRHQKAGDFKKAFDGHEKNFSKKKVKSWRAALKRLADTSGFRAHERRESDLIKEIVGVILRSLNQVVSNIQQSCPKKGFELSNVYEGSGLIANVREVYEKGGQVVPKQLPEVLNATNLNIHEVVERIILFMRELCREHNFVFLDDVDNCLEQLYNLARDHAWFGSKSKIILTARNKHMLTKIYKVEPLNDYATSELFRVSISIPSFTTVEADHLWLANKSRVDFEYLDYGSDHYVSRTASICIHDEFGTDSATNSNSKVMECEIRAIFYKRIHQSHIFPIGGIYGEDGQVSMPTNLDYYSNTRDNYAGLDYSGSVEPLTEPRLDDSGNCIEEESGRNHDSVEPITKLSADDSGYNMKKDDGGNSDTDVKEEYSICAGGEDSNPRPDYTGSVGLLPEPCPGDSSYSIEGESGGNHDSVEPITKPSVDDSNCNMKKEDGGNSDTDVKEGCWFIEIIVRVFKRLGCCGME